MVLITGQYIMDEVGDEERTCPWAARACARADPVHDTTSSRDSIVAVRTPRDASHRLSYEWHDTDSGVLALPRRLKVGKVEVKVDLLGRWRFYS